MKRLLAVMTFLLIAAFASAAPPDVKKSYKIKPGQFLRISVTTTEEIGQAKSFTDEEAFFGELVSPKGQRQFVFQAPERNPDGSYTGKGHYTISWWTKGEIEGTITTIEIDTGAVVTPPPKKPDDPPPGPPTGKLYFLVIRPDGPTSPEFTKIMTNPGWASLRSAGHSVGAATVTESIPLKLNIQAGTPLPTVVTLRVSADGRSSTKVREPVPLPSTTDAILKLPEGVN